MTSRRIFSRLRVSVLALTLGCMARAEEPAPAPPSTESPPPPPPPARAIEVIAYGSGAGELRVFQGGELKTFKVGSIPPGPAVTIPAAGPVEFQRRGRAADGQETWTRVASVELPATGELFTAILVPHDQPDEQGLKYGVRLFPKPAKLPVGACELTNLTSSRLLVQLDNSGVSFEVEPWTQHVFTPKVDHKFRALLRLSHRSKAAGDWKVVKAGVISLPPDQALRANFIFAADGLGDLLDADEYGRKNPASDDPAMFVMEENVPVAATDAPDAPAEAAAP